MQGNPFTLMFGKVASSIVPRRDTVHSIIEEFEKDMPQNQAYLFTGIRGCGKTVIMRETACLLREHGWIVLDLNAQGDLIRSYSQTLFEEGKKNKLFSESSLTLGAPYVSLTVKKQPLSDDPEIVARQLTKDAFEHGKRILVTIDEVVATESLRLFANFFQSVMGLDVPLCLLLTGIRENIEAISSDRSMSFLSRLPKINLGPLDLGEEAIEYSKALNISLSTAAVLAKRTEGYAYAYQVLGHFLYEQKKTEIDEELWEAVSTHLWCNGYDVLWRDLTKVDKAFLVALAESTSKEALDVRSRLHMSESNYQNYRRRLMKRGYLRADAYGKIAFALPAFDTYALFMNTFE
ncbi:MAG: hypothetical protein IJS52_08630 [Bacilli bacterium]|nr:hypothetical protein [Bacilli bacterium]